MTSLELRESLAELKWSHSAFADKCGVHPNTVTRWTSGATEVPKVVGAYVSVMVRLKEMLNG
jgi:transcriptional regulator with XRE-family HTH domain